MRRSDQNHELNQEDIDFKGFLALLLTGVANLINVFRKYPIFEFIPALIMLNGLFRGLFERCSFFQVGLVAS